MSFTFDTKSNGSGAGDPVNVAHTCSASTKVLIAIVVGYIASRVGGVPTYNSINMVDSGEGKVSCFNKSYMEVFYLLNPSTGSSYNVSVPNTNLDTLYIAVASFEASGTVTKHASNSGENDTADPSINVTTTVDNGLMVGGLVHDLSLPDTIVEGANYTELYLVDMGGDTYSGEYDLDWGSSGAIAVDYTADADDWGLIGLAFEEAAVADVIGPFPTHFVIP